jgi:histidinol-phosphate/aromatic aminotransferase/cobyric acid decarboxylase-like protein
MCKIKKKNMNAKELSQRLFISDKIFIKDLSNKMGDAFFRIAVRTSEDNRKLIVSLKRHLS